MENKSSIDATKQSLRPLADEALRIIEEMHNQFGASLSEPGIRIMRARAHGALHVETPLMFLTACINYIGTLRGICKMRKITYVVKPLEDELFELMKAYKVAHVLITVKDAPLW